MNTCQLEFLQLWDGGGWADGWVGEVSGAGWGCAVGPGALCKVRLMKRSWGLELWCGGGREWGGWGSSGSSKPQAGRSAQQPAPCWPENSLKMEQLGVLWGFSTAARKVSRRATVF